MTKDEQKRTEIFEAESAKLASEGYVSKDILISGAKANTVGMLLGLVPIVPFAKHSSTNEPSTVISRV